MAWPLVFALFLGAVALCAVATRYLRLEKPALSYGSIIQRLFLLQALGEMQWRLPFLYREEEWRPFYKRFKGVLEEVQAAARPMGDDRVLIMKRLSEAIDRHLVSYLQSQPDLVKLLQGCMPASGQSWASMPTRARDNSGNESDTSDNESDSLDDESDSLFHRETPEEKVPEALEGMRMLVDSLLQGLDDINSSVSAGATRGESDLISHQVPADFITVFYATDRQMTVDGEYSGLRSKRSEVLKLHYGRMTVAVPGRAKGVKIPGPKKHVEADPCEHIVIISMNTELGDDEDGFVKILGEELHKADGNQERKTNAVLLFIHGFNVSHKEAIKGAARLKRDINFKGEVIVYSWSSSGVCTVPAYYHDASNIEKTVDCLEGFIKTITSKIPGNPDVHIVAHSMGNRGLIEALKEGKSIAPTMKNVVFAAADVGREHFDNMVRNVKRAPTRSDHQQRSPLFTVYSSKDDKALSASKVLNRSKPRLGDTRSFLDSGAEEKGSDQVDVTGRKVTNAWIHHSYYGAIPKVLEDIEDVVTLNLNADERCQQNTRIKSVTHKGKKFFAFDASVWEQRCR